MCTGKLSQNWCARVGSPAQSTSDNAAPGQLVLYRIRKQTEQAMESKAVIRIPPLSLHPFLPPGSFHVS